MIFLEEIKNSELIEKKSLQYLLECIIALRFGWLAEWLRKNDVEMIDLEITYMHLLATNKDLIKNKWHL